MSETLYLIDASSYVYRAFFALPELTDSRGFPTNAIYGVTTMLQRLLQELAPTRLAAVLDRPEPTFRHERYPDYKANRQDMPDNLSAQLPHIRTVYDAFRIPVVEKPGYEADDIIATLAHQAAADGAAVVIISGDKDLLQLVSPQITMLDTMKNRLWDEAAVREKYGLGPASMVDMFGLIGDQVDNVPGVPGIGPKTAVQLLRDFATIQGIYDHLDSITRKKLKETLATNRDQAFLSRDLVRVDRNVALACEWPDLVLGPPDEESLRELFKRFEFTRLLKDLGPESGAGRNCDYRLVTDMDGVRTLLATLRGQGAFTVDLETTSPDPMRAEIVGISFSFRDDEAWYVPVAHCTAAAQPAREEVLRELRPLLADECIGKTGHNIKYEYIVFERAGAPLRGIACDTMVASYVLNPSKYRHNLDDVALDHLDHRMIAYKDVVGTGKKAVTFDQVPLERARDYSCEDADITGRLERLLLPQVEAGGLADLFHRIEMPLVPVLARMEMHGVRVDVAGLQTLSREFGARLATQEQRIYEMAGERFNVNSPKQLGVVLFEHLGLPVQKKTKTGYATDMATLRELSNHHPLPAEILEYRSMAKLLSTYVDAMPTLVHPQTGRIHTSYNQTTTATGRLSSSEPNLQNIPVRTEEGRRIRAAFVAEPGWHLLSADYSQIELRILAHLSGDTTLIEAFQNDEDIHARTAAEIWGADAAQQRRRDAKAINFGIIYGMSSYGLAAELGIAPQQAQEYIQSYFARYSRVREYLDGVLEKARVDGYVATLMHRRRYLPEITARNGAVRKFAERTAINAPIQGTAADLIKIAMINIDRLLFQEKLATRMIMQVHDELVFEVPADETSRVAALIREEMEGVLALAVPLRVDVHQGDNWRDAH